MATPRRPLFKNQPALRRLRGETFGLLCERGFELELFCDPCRQVERINLQARPDLDEIELGQASFECRRWYGRAGRLPGRFLLLSAIGSLQVKEPV
jgi:hypothetical protein